MKTVALSNSKAKALVCDDDYRRVVKHTWFLEERANGQCYVRTTINGKTTRLHRFVLRVKDGSGCVDHKDHNGLNNQRSNLRVASWAENSRNRIKWISKASDFKGVSRRGRFWRAQILWEGRSIELGMYDRADKAAAAYDGAAKVLFGRFAHLNKP